MTPEEEAEFFRRPLPASSEQRILNALKIGPLTAWYLARICRLWPIRLQLALRRLKQSGDIAVSWIENGNRKMLRTYTLNTRAEPPPS